MAKSYFLAHSISYRYITFIADYIHLQLKAHSPLVVEFVVCDVIDGIKFDDGSLVFTIGMFGKFSRQPTCRYVRLYTDLLYLGHAASHSAAGKRLIDNKKLRFAQDVHLYDSILDYHVDQTAPINEEFGVPTKVFPLCVTAPMQRERIYDVCAVGTPTPRRVTIEKRLSRLGVRLSPSFGVTFEEVAAQSRIVLNIHAYRFDNVELPRMVGAMIAGAALVTETSRGAEQYLPQHLYLEAAYTDLVDLIFALLRQPERTTAMATAASKWMKSVYAPECEARWQTLLACLYREHDLALRGSSSSELTVPNV